MTIPNEKLQRLLDRNVCVNILLTLSSPSYHSFWDPKLCASGFHATISLTALIFQGLREDAQSSAEGRGAPKSCSTVRVEPSGRRQ